MAQHLDRQKGWSHSLPGWFDRLTVALFAVGLLIVIVVAALMAGWLIGDGNKDVWTGDATSTPTSLPQWTPTATVTQVNDPTPTPEPTATETAEPTATPTAIETAQPTATPTATETAQPTATPTPTQTPTQAPTPVITEWRGEYYANDALTGAPDRVRNDQAINFDWGYGSPAAGLPVDRFSARWTRRIVFAEGTYLFRVLVDDGIRLYVDGALILDEWRDGSLREATAERVLSAGEHAIRVEYYERSGAAVAQVWWEKKIVYHDWKGEYWSNRTLSGDPVVVRNDPAIDFVWGWGSPDARIPADRFSARWTRSAYFDRGTYRFHAIVDDGVRLTVDGWLVLDAWSDREVQELVTDVALTQGTHAIAVEYYEQVGNARITVWWERVASPAYPDWKGQYWPNRTLSGEPALVRNDLGIDYNWRAGAPSPGLPADDFSVRWTQRAQFNGLTYRFHALVDDGVRLWVDDRLVIDAWVDQGAREVTGELAIARGVHPVRVEYYEHGGDAQIHVWWEEVTPAYPDWKARYWTNTNLSGEPALVRNDAAIDYDWGAGAPAVGLPDDGFSARWTRQLWFEPGVYRLSAWADDRVRVYVDGELLIDEWHGWQDEVYTADLALSGAHDLKIEYAEQSGDAHIRFWWKRLGDLPTPTPEPEGVQINELLSAPQAMDWDGDGTASDRDEWIELYNASVNAVDLSGWRLDAGDPKNGPYQLPQGVVLDAGEYLILYRQKTGLALADGGGTVRLLDLRGVIVDSVTFGPLDADVSYGRGEAGDWSVMPFPSPGAANVSPGTPSINANAE